MEKGRPEAEALTVVEQERIGTFHILTEEPSPSPAWFISHTSFLNSIGPEPKVTWSPESFIEFVGTLAGVTKRSDTATAERAFETLLWNAHQLLAKVC